MAIRKFSDSVYNKVFYLVYDETDEKILHFVKKKVNAQLKLEDITNTAGLVIDNELDIFFIIIRHLHREFLETLLHECFHATARMFRYIGAELTKESEEAYAYYFEWLFKECLKRSKKDIEGSKQMANPVSKSAKSNNRKTARGRN